jgi:hypothetical protein
VTVDSVEDPAENRQAMPAVGGHAVPYSADAGPHARRPGGVQLVLTFYCPPLQVSSTSQADTDLRMHPQSHQVAVLELAATAPTHRSCPLRRLLFNGHTAIMRPLE